MSGPRLLRQWHKGTGDETQAIMNWSSQVWPFANEMKQGDLVVTPLKIQHAIQIGEIASDYHFEAQRPDPFFRWGPVKWVAEAVPRGHFGKDLLNCFGAFMTIRTMLKCG